MRTQILYLYSEIQSHNLPVLARLASSHGALVDVIRWNRDKLTPFTPAERASTLLNRGMVHVELGRPAAAASDFEANMPSMRSVTT